MVTVAGELGATGRLLAELVEPVSFDVAGMDVREVRRLRESKQQKLTGLRARLNLLITGAVQFELDRIGDDGVEVIAAAAGMAPEEVWRILAGEYRTSPIWWRRIERVLMLCRPSQEPEKVLQAQELFVQIARLDKEVGILTQRAAELLRRRRAAQLYPAGTGRHPDEGDGGKAPVPRPAEADGKQEAPAPAESEAPKTRPASSWQTPAIPDLHGHDQRPDPLQATTEAEFVAAMRAYRIWAGNPSLRQMQDRCGGQISYSTFRNMLAGTTVPTQLATLETFVRVLGGTAEDLQRWTTAWRRFALRQSTSSGP